MKAIRNLDYNDVVTYRAAYPAAVNEKAPVQLEAGGPYTGKIVDLEAGRVGVRRDGFHGRAPLYYVYHSDIISIEDREE